MKDLEQSNEINSKDDGVSSSISPSLKYHGKNTEPKQISFKAEVSGQTTIRADSIGSGYKFRESSIRLSKQDSSLKSPHKYRR